MPYLKKFDFDFIREFFPLIKYHSKPSKHRSWIINRNSIGKTGKRSPCIGRGKTIVEQATVDSIGTPTTKCETTFRLVVLFLGIVYLDSYDLVCLTEINLSAFKYIP